MAVSERGDGRLFLDPSADQARDHFRTKRQGLVDKVMSVADAVRKYVVDGTYLAVGGFGVDRIPTAALHEIVRQNPQNLGFSGHTATHDFQILAAGNLTGRGRLLAKVDVAYVVGLEARGLSPHARRVMESGEVEICEWTNYALAVRLRAAASGVPFLPARTMLGTDTFRHSAAMTIRCPFTDQLLVALPALSPDVAIIHVHECDRYGNARIGGTSVCDLDLARASKSVILTCERLIPDDEIRRRPDRTVIPFYCVDAVCEVPFGSFPGNMPYEYFSDEDHLRAWLVAEKTEEANRVFLDRHLFGVSTFDEYLQICGGLERMRQLRAEEFLLDRGVHS
jgi:glutaconate CoA-transferase subunit A